MIPYKPPQPNRTRRGKMIITACVRNCKLHFDSLPSGIGEMIHGWIEEGANNETIIARAKQVGVSLSNGSIGNHKRKHLKLAASALKGGVIQEEAPPMTELEVVDEIIQQGGRRVGLTGQNVTTEQLLRAIELKFKLTQGSVFEAMYAAMSGIGGPDDSELEDLDPASQVPERQSALRSDDEAAQVGAE